MEGHAVVFMNCSAMVLITAIVATTEVDSWMSWERLTAESDPELDSLLCTAHKIAVVNERVTLDAELAPTVKVWPAAPRGASTRHRKCHALSKYTGSHWQHRSIP